MPLSPKLALDAGERHAPLILAAATLCVNVATWRLGLASLVNAQFTLKDVMSATFNVVAFATPLTIGLFAITLSPGGGFIAKVFGTKMFRMFVNYVIVAFVLGICALLITVPYLTVRDGAKMESYLQYGITVWWMVAAAALAAIARVVIVFLVWAKSYTS